MQRELSLLEILGAVIVVLLITIVGSQAFMGGNSIHANKKAADAQNARQRSGAADGEQIRARVTD